MVRVLPRLVVFGEALTDFIHDGSQRWSSIAGGSCWNVARVGARLGIPTGFAGTVSRDVFGDELVQRSVEAGLDMRFMHQVDRPPLLAMVVSKHPPNYFFVGEHSADLAFDEARLPDGWFEAAEALHFGSLGVVREPLATRLIGIAEAARAAGKRISFDPNFRAPMAHPSYRATLRRMVELTDYLKVSDEDLAALFPELDEAAAIAQLRAWSPHGAILVTRGAAGMALLRDGQRVFQPAFPVALVDTVGCGDACVGGWMTSLLAAPDAPDPVHLRFAAACAALAAAHAGPYAASGAEVERLLATAPVGASANLD